MIWQIKLLVVGSFLLSPNFCEALLEDAFDSDIELLAEETDSSAADARAPREAAYFYEPDHYPRFHSPPSNKGYLPPPGLGQQHDYGNSYDSDEYDYDYDVPRIVNRPHSHHHHHHHHHGDNERQNPNRGFPNNENNGGFIQVQNPFIPANNGRPFQGPSQVGNLASNNRGPIQVPSPSNNGRPLVTLPSQAPPFINPRPVVVKTTPIPVVPPTQVVATPPTTTPAPVISSTAEGDPFNIDIRFGN